jgi:hypothetical protein
MRALAPDEKTTTVMVYTQNLLARGDVITKEGVRVSIWLRTQGVPNYIRLLKPQVILLGGGGQKSLALQEIFVPVPEVMGFHLAPPAQDPPDFDASEQNRILQPVELLLGSFLMKAKVRISSQTDIATSLDVMHVAWASVYEAEITNPGMPQFSMRVPMLLVNPNRASFGLVG